MAEVLTDTHEANGGVPTKRPNIVLYIADEFRWDFVGASQLNPTTRTPHLDGVARRGVNFTHAITNHPLCTPSRSGLFTGRYATETGPWRNSLGLNKSFPTLAGELHRAGYTTNYIGKWHLASYKDGGVGPVWPQDRGGFVDLWEGANSIEDISHPYSGTIWDTQGKPIHYEHEYRVDFLTGLAVNFLKQHQERPFLLCISQLEPHFQNDVGKPIAPKEYAARYQNAFVPPDLLHLPGVWQQQLPDYYGCVEKIDESVGVVLDTLKEQNLLENTIFVFTSDHGCHFQTRDNNYKRTPHDSSIRIPLVMQGPGIGPEERLDQIVGNINITPTLLELAGAPTPASMKGRSAVPLIRDRQKRRDWRERELIQISQMNESGVGRAIRTAQWTYCVLNPTEGASNPRANSYEEYALFDNFADPAQMVNLLARPRYKDQTADLKQQLLSLIEESGEERPTIIPARLCRP